MFNLVKFDYFSDSVFRDNQVQMVKKLSPNFCLVLNIFTIKKAAVVSNFCLIGKIRHDFLVSTMIELDCKTFMPFQTSDLDRVKRLHNKRLFVDLHFLLVLRPQGFSDCL